jgi:hypothetical protein
MYEHATVWAMPIKLEEACDLLTSGIALRTRAANLGFMPSISGRWHVEVRAGCKKYARLYWTPEQRARIT